MNFILRQKQKNQEIMFNQIIQILYYLQYYWNMKKKSKTSKLKSSTSKIAHLAFKQELNPQLKKSIEHIKKYKSPEAKITLEIGKQSRFTRRMKSPDLRSPNRLKSKEHLTIQTPMKPTIRSMKNTPNKSLAGIQNSVLFAKDKVKTKVPTKLTSEGKTAAFGHRKTKSQQIITNKSLNYDLFMTRNSTLKTIIKSCSHRTRSGMLEGKSKTNQDALIVEPYYLTAQCSLFAVCDGHGINGHFVSEIVKKQLPTNLQFFLMKNQLLGRKEIDFESVQYSLKMAFKKTSCDVMVSDVDVDFSGSTCVSVFMYNKNVWCSNIGDSRAVIFSQSQKKQYVPFPLSHDHKGEDPIQAKRILGMGGKLQSYHDQDGEPVGPLRVWIPDKNIPGLAMTRSFGDYFASTVGVTADPQILYRKLKREDKFMVIGSDGLWQFIDCKSVSEIVRSYYLNMDCDGACKALQKAAVRAWQDEDQIIDDITIIVIFFDN